MKTTTLLLSSIFILTSNIAIADFFIVDRFEDAPDNNPGDGQCKGLNMVGATCSLRAAIMEAGASVGEDVILVPHGTDFVLSHIGDDDDFGTTGDLDIIGDIKIQNGTQGFVIDGNGTDRIFHVLDGSKLTLENGKLTNGVANTEDTFEGGAIKVEMDGTLIIDDVEIVNNIANRGGAIFNDGDILIENSYIHHNAITSENAPINLPSEGNAILNRKNIILSTSTLSHNGLLISNTNNISLNQAEYAIHVNPNGANAAQPATNLFNSTIANNQYGGLRLFKGITNINQSTIANHQHQGIRFTRRTGNLYEGELQLTIKNSVLANNGTQDCNDLWVFHDNMVTATEVDLLGNFNASTDTSCGFEGVNNQQNINDPFNGSLSDWGGKTPTLMIKENSDVIDLVTGNCSSKDQRGSVRPLDGNNSGFAFCDSGAIEFDRSSDPIESDLIFKNSFELIL
jgi:CSLREA domain-containing protein